ncbi:methylated-DNA--[protein]-cysteine S-methyltransferase [Candidatus Phycosocius spiralis]|uniref:Methylated-DNA--protein-cysteine methyltransferase n=1 Tax=Candidatus Phycosocius spiralis TaxID=2815099 RepID=A0ABQ4PX99_9PROT|nr:methylated-DNA--[protein]-cysteine S-methyltransferase [Candidatus Phycosocius spiralis]GIU67657.1 methylated-DNA--protein-cysteine methyltransferase [Candidatus Phycosocius spiralis]
MKLFLDHIPSPMGEMMLVTDQDGKIRMFEWVDHQERMDRLLARQYKSHYHRFKLDMVKGSAPIHIRQALDAYFNGQITAIEDLETATGGTEFQKTIWRALRTIPAGTTLTYGDLATQIGKPKAVRAVGLANGANPIAIIVPCHRVIGANGTLTGYGGGLARKQWLLMHEQALRAPNKLNMDV